jgi:urea transporter
VEAKTVSIEPRSPRVDQFLATPPPFFLALTIRARLVRMEKHLLESGYYTYNPLLVGLSIGCLFHLNPVTIFFIIASGVLAFLATVFLARTSFKLTCVCRS